MNTGLAVGGPADGKELSAEVERVIVPVKVGPDRGHGDRGFSAAMYKWVPGFWMYGRGDH